MHKKLAAAAFALLMTTAFVQPAAALVSNASVERIGPDQVTLHWTASGPVDVLEAVTPDADVATATLVSKADRDGKETVKAVATAGRSYFLIRDRGDGSVARVAERLVPLQQGSNFRDIGGYPGADGKHVRWGLIYRSGATAMLTPTDVATVKGLGLTQLVDLRSDEERVLAPTRIDDVPYTAVGYSMQRIFDSMKSGTAAPQNGGALYRHLPTMLAPQMRLLFAALLRKQGAIEYNCSAGQDRTGFATAMILAALGVPRDVILKDYHLSTGYRQPNFEMPEINPAAHPGNPVAVMFARSNGVARKAEPLYDPDGKSFLTSAFEEIDSKYGSVEGYLNTEVGITQIDIAALRTTYLE